MHTLTRASAVVLLTTACVATPDAPPHAAPEPARIVLDSREVPGDFLLRQHLRFSWTGGAGEADAVVQSACGELVVIILGPMQSPALVIRQRGTEVRLEKAAAVPMPFPPESILSDVHRVYFVPIDAIPSDQGSRTVVWHGLSIAESWRGGRVVERRFAGASNAAVVTYPDGAVPGELPRHAVLENDLPTYRIEVSTLSRQEVACRP